MDRTRPIKPNSPLTSDWEELAEPQHLHGPEVSTPSGAFRRSVRRSKRMCSALLKQGQNHRTSTRNLRSKQHVDGLDRPPSRLVPASPSSASSGYHGNNMVCFHVHSAPYHGPGPQPDVPISPDYLFRCTRPVWFSHPRSGFTT